MQTATSTSPATRKLAIVTGGSRGLGRNTVLNLAQKGVDSIFTYRSNVDEARKVVALAEAAGARAWPLQLDTGSTAGFADFAGQVSGILAQRGVAGFDYLVNNAGAGHHAAFAATTEADLDSLYQVHVKGVFFLTQTLLPLMVDGGRIVNISSGLARFALAGSSAYAMMKGAVEVLTRYLAVELGARGIAVNTVAPGAIATDFNGGTVRDNAAVNSRVAAMTALGRVGEADDIGPMIAALLGDDNRWINAQRIEVSGGMNI
jgi:NAD(P)-dependent dehydrogenase (short-subunit alcohol dehydrogenase family)